jgi:hypothetical protein
MWTCRVPLREDTAERGRPAASASVRAMPRCVRPGDSRALYYSDGLGGRSGNWVDGTARREPGADLEDENPHLAR